MGMPKGTCLCSELCHCPPLALVPLPPFVTAMAPELWGSAAAQSSAAAAQLPSPLLEWLSQAHTAGPPCNTFLGVSMKLIWEDEELCKVGSDLGRDTPEPGWFCFSWKAMPHFHCMQGRLVLQPINKLWWCSEFCFFLFLVRGNPALMY